MASKAWKQHERKAAKTFGTLRNVGSGSQGRPDKSASDSVHTRLFIEAKTRAKSVIRGWLMTARTLARKEGKTAVLAVREGGKPHAIWCVYEPDLPAFVAEWVGANYTPDLMDEIYVAIKRAKGIEEGDF